VHLGADQQTASIVTMWRVAQGSLTPTPPRTVREPLGSYGSRCSAADIQQAPMDKESWVARTTRANQSRAPAVRARSRLYL